MILIVKKYRSPDQIITLITAWLAGVGAILLLAGSMHAARFTKIENKEVEVKRMVVLRSQLCFAEHKTGRPDKNRSAVFIKEFLY